MRIHWQYPLSKPTHTHKHKTQLQLLWGVYMLHTTTTTINGTQHRLRRGVEWGGSAERGAHDDGWIVGGTLFATNWNESERDCKYCIVYIEIFKRERERANAIKIGLLWWLWWLTYRVRRRRRMWMWMWMSVWCECTYKTWSIAHFLDIYTTVQTANLIWGKQSRIQQKTS